MIQSTTNFDFSKLTLNQPYSIQGGSYFTKLLSDGEQIYIQSPRCMTKQGIIKSGQKIYTDLLFTQNDTKFVEWLEELETTLHGLIYEKRKLWFHNDLDMTDIETAFTSPIKVFKSGKNYLIRCNLGKIEGLNFESPVRIFNENEVDLKITDITNTTPLICIIEISGVRFSSRSFHIDLNIKQMMVIQSASTFDKCLINLHENDYDNDNNNTNDDDDVDNDSDDYTDDKNEEEGDNDAVDDDTVDLEGHDKKDDIDKNTQYTVDEEITSTNNVTDDSVNNLNNNESIDTKLHDNSLYTQENNNQPIKDVLKESEYSDSLGNNNNLDSESSNNSENRTNDDINIKSLNTNNSINNLEEVDINLTNIKDSIELKAPTEVYMELYLQARERAKLAKKAAIDAYMEAKHIKKSYLLDDTEESDDEFAIFSDSGIEK